MKLMLVAGEASGDAHGRELLKELNHRTFIPPSQALSNASLDAGSLRVRKARCISPH